MKSIWKYPITVQQEPQIIEIPLVGNGVIHAGVDPNGQPCIWAEVDSSLSSIPVAIRLVGTGWDIGESLDEFRHVGSFVAGGCFVWHVYESH